MTSVSEIKLRRHSISDQRPGHWRLQDAKARFSELVRLAGTDGPQHVTVRGREEVVIVSEEDFRRLSGSLTGRALIEACRASPYPDIAIAPKRIRPRVRDVEL